MDHSCDPRCGSQIKPGSALENVPYIFEENVYSALLVVGDGNGNPLQYSCLENPVDRGAWRAVVHRVAQSCDTTEAT